MADITEKMNQLSVKETTPANAETYSLHISDLDKSVNESNLYDLFSQFGVVVSIKLCRDAVTKESLCHAYVNYPEKEFAVNALEQLNFSEINGKQCRITWAIKDLDGLKNSASNVYVKHLSPDVDDAGFYAIFKTFGEILSSKIQYDSEGKSKGFGFVQYKDKQSAENVISAMNGVELEPGYVLSVCAHMTKEQRDTKLQNIKNEYTNVFFKNVSAEGSDEEIKQLFSEKGEVSSFTISRKEKSPVVYGFCNFVKHEDAVKAVEALNDSEFKGFKIFVGRAQKTHERKAELQKAHNQAIQERNAKFQDCNLFIKNIPKSFKEEKLQELFSPYGEIVSCKISTRGDDSLGHGFVLFSKKEEAAAAIEGLNGTTIEQKDLYVGLFQKKADRSNMLNREFEQKFNRFGGPGVPMGVPNFPQGMPPQMMYPNVYPGQIPPNGFNQIPMRGFPIQQRMTQFPPQFKHQLGSKWFGHVLAAVGGSEEKANEVTNMLLSLPETKLSAMIADETAFNQELNEAVRAFEGAAQ
ncbi:hypothetical protein FOG50_03890 [Hanseniaspora uvarum]|nr:hypothetical protein FOG48_02467 [Hanseniaspora uvarum]KAF0275277.1 hypothetical protein FOG50_03890 [Hanseniaspora uvarum]GMM42014.1 polyadenylate-binding protein [Hanseniaspora uvarum]